MRRLILLLVVVGLSWGAQASIEGRYKFQNDANTIFRIKYINPDTVLLTPERLGVTKTDIPPVQKIAQLLMGPYRHINGSYFSVKNPQVENRHEVTIIRVGNSYQVKVVDAHSASLPFFSGEVGAKPNVGLVGKYTLVKMPAQGSTPAIGRDLAGRWTVHSGPEQEVNKYAVDIFENGSSSGFVHLWGPVNSMDVKRKRGVADTKISTSEYKGSSGHFTRFKFINWSRMKAWRNDGIEYTLAREAKTPPLTGVEHRVAELIIDEDGNSILHRSVMTNNLQQLERYAHSRSLDINLKNKNGDTALHLAVAAGNSHMVSRLIRARAKTDIADASGRTAIQAAIVSGRADLLKPMRNSASAEVDNVVKAGNANAAQVLVGAGVSAASIASSAIRQQQGPFLEAFLPNNKTVVTDSLYKQALSNSEEMARIVLKTKSPSLNVGTALLATFAAKKMTLIPDLLEAGADPGLALREAVKAKSLNLATELVEVYGVDATLGLGNAIAQKDMAIVDMLMLNGADPNNGIQTAIKKNDPVFIKKMLDAGADANKPTYMMMALRDKKSLAVETLLNNNADGTNPDYIKMAAEQGDITMVSALLKAGAPAQVGLKGGVASGNKQVVAALLGAGARIEDSSLLVTAASNSRNSGPLEALLDAGGDANAKSSAGTPLAVLAAGKGTYHSLQALQAKGADLNAKDAKGNQAIHAAVRSKDLNKVELLIRAGVELNTKNNAGKTPRALAGMFSFKLKSALKKAGAKK